MAEFLGSAGKMRAPLCDKRRDPNARQGDLTYRSLNVKYVRACGREISIRMLYSRSLTSEYEMRALMDKYALNLMLSAYCGAEGSNNCLLICA